MVACMQRALFQLFQSKPKGGSKGNSCSQGYFSVEKAVVQVRQKINPPWSLTLTRFSRHVEVPHGSMQGQWSNKQERGHVGFLKFS